MKASIATYIMSMRNTLLILLALGALGDGGVLTIFSGQLMGISLSMVAGAPFRDFLVLGILLFTVLGVAPCLLVVVLLKKPVSHFAERLNFFGDMHTVTISTVTAGHKCAGALQFYLC